MGLHHASRAPRKLPQSLGRQWYLELTLLEATGATHRFCYPGLRMWRLRREEVLEPEAPNRVTWVQIPALMLPRQGWEGSCSHWLPHGNQRHLDFMRLCKGFKLWTSILNRVVPCSTESNLPGVPCSHSTMLPQKPRPIPQGLHLPGWEYGRPSQHGTVSPPKPGE